MLGLTLKCQLIEVSLLSPCPNPTTPTPTTPTPTTTTITSNFFDGIFKFEMQNANAKCKCEMQMRNANAKGKIQNAKCNMLCLVIKSSIGSTDLFALIT